MPDKRKLHVLDGMRGIAACTIMAFHLKPSLVPHGYLAVDFFFMLSGFVMALAYQRKLDSGEWSFKRFMLERTMRLYPLYLVGLTCGLLFALIYGDRGALSLPKLAVSFTFGLGYLPTPSRFGGSERLFPLDSALWSLLFEMIAYAVHAMVLLRRPVRWLYAGVTVGVVALIAEGVLHRTLDLGFSWATLGGGFARITFAYFAGLIIYRVWQQKTVSFAVSPFVVVAGLLLLLTLPVRSIWFDLAAVLIAFPLCLLAGAYSHERAWLTPILVILGEISYAVYVIHLPMFAFMSRVLEHASFAPRYSIQHIGFALTVVIAALILDKVYDVPVRAYLRRFITHKAEVSV